MKDDLAKLIGNVRGKRGSSSRGRRAGYVSSYYLATTKHALAHFETLQWRKQLMGV